MVAERIRKSINDSYFSVSDSQPPVHITVSIGVATSPYDSSGINELIEFADKALYFSKETGKNKVSVWSEIPAGAVSDS